MDNKASESGGTTSKKPKYNRFTQQELHACDPILTPRRVIGAFIGVGIVFIPICVATLLASGNVVEIVSRYDKDCIPSDSKDDMTGYIQSSLTNKTCVQILTVRKKMKRPIFVYYQINNFYQNHRLYTRSRNHNQLARRKDENDTDNCYGEKHSDSGDVIVPCGLVAWSLFNDTYRFALKSTELQVNRKGIAWKSDIGGRFGSDVYPKNFQTGNFIGGKKLLDNESLNEQEDFMVWMRTAAFPTFRKLYGRIESDLEADENVTVIIENNYNTYSFGGEKRLVLSTATWIGGKNDIIGLAYLVVAGLCFILAMSYLILHLYKPMSDCMDPTLLWIKDHDQECVRSSN